MRQPSKMRAIICVVCGSGFQGNHSQAKNCSPECKRVSDRKSWRKYGARNKSKKRKYHKGYYEKNKDKVLARTLAYSKTEKGKQVRKLCDSSQRLRYPQRYKARQAVLIAKRKGLLIPQPCEICATLRVEAHHKDYSKPLDVVWLCVICHKRLHKVGIYIEDGEITNKQAV